MELRQAIQAFRNAEAAGDVEAASRLARFIDQNLNQQPQAEAPAAPVGNAGFSLGDLLTSFGQGAVGSTKALTDVAGADNALSQKLEGAVTSLQGGLSAARQAEMQRQEERAKRAAESGSTWEEIKAAAQSVAEAPLQSAAQALGSFVPYIPTMFLGPGAAVLGLGARATAAATAVARAAPSIIGTAQGAGAVKSAIYDRVLDAELKDGVPEAEARAKAAAAQDYIGENIDQILLGAGAGFVSGKYGAESLLRPGVVNAAGRSALGRVGLAAATDVPTEAFQGGQEQLASNLALQRLGYNTPTFEGVAGKATQEGLMGLLGSAPVAIVSGRSASRAELDRIQQEEAARLAVSEEELAQRFPDTLPGGFKIEQEELGREIGPQGYNIMAEGREQPLSSVDTEEEANAKLESLTKIRAEERENLLKEEEKINSSIQKAQQNLERLEATEQTDTDEYRSLKAQLPTMMDESAQKIKDTYDKIEALSKPLAVAPFGEVERVNSQFKLFSPDNQQVGVFKTREQAEGAIEQSIGEDTFKQAKENQAAAKELYKTFVPQMRKFGLGDVGLNIVDRIENGAGGAYLDKLIRVSLEDSNPVQTMRHESLHALKDLGFFTPQQWKALEGRASKEWIDKYLKGQMAAGEDGQPLVRDGRNVTRYDLYKEMNLSDQDIIEEAIADAFGDYDKGAKPPPGMIAALFRKLKAFFANLSQALRGAGFQSADDIFQAVERGELKPAAKAKPEKAAPTAEERRSLRKSPKDVSGKIKPGEKQRTSEKTDEQLRSEQPAVRPSARGDQGVETARGAEPEPRRIAPLEGAPSVPGFSGPIPEIVDAAERYARQNGIPFKRQAEYVRVNPERATRIAEAYAQMPHAPNDPAVRAAYKDLVSQTTAQYKALVDAGYKFWFMDMSKPDNQKYASTPWNAMRDLKDNKQMGVFPTNDGFGSNEDFSAEANPLLAETEFKWPIGGLDGELQPVLANDLFRAVHDAFGHGLEGAGFRADGEENAWQAHVLLFKGPAVGAITSETRGQNSWLNFGPYGEKNRTAKVEDTTFADQKTGLMPEWTWTEGRAGEEPKGISLGKKQPGASSFEGIHYGISKVDSLSGSKYGTGIRGAERRRLENSDDERIKKRVYFYVQKPDGTMPVPEAGLGGYIYTQKFDNVLAPGAEMSRLSREAAGDFNTFESLVVDAGYDGYAIPDMGMMVVLNHNVPVNYEGTRAERGGKYSLRRLDSKEFKDWLGKSKIVDKDGKPLVMYHGLAKDTTDFTRKTKRGAPIFLTDDPDFAQVFATDSYESVARNPEKYLSKEQISGGVKRAIAAIKKDYGKDSLGKEMVESLQTGDLKDATPEAREYIQKELISLLPTGPHIMPLYVRAENPFDYDNPEHVTKVVFELNKTTDSNGRRLGVKMSKDIENGNWGAIEDGYVQDAIKALGFDSFYVEEQGRKNLAVYEPNQVKSATGNVGTYSRDSNDVRYSLRNVAFPTVKEAKEAAEAVEVPDTMEFKRYIAGNQWVDEDGKAKKFYHATTSNFFEFNEGVIYLSDTAEESEKWGRMAEDRLREQIYRALNKDEKLPFFQKAVDEAVSNDKITQAQGEKFMRDAGRKIPEFDGYDLIKKEMDEALLSLAPDRMKIMPLYARAVTPFDFRNKDHVQQVMGAYNYTQEMDRKIGDVAKQVNKEIGGAPTVNVENILDGLKGILAQGYPKVVERPDIIRTIRKLGFDGYITRRNRNAPLSYAVFKPEQVKSITGNDGEFGVENKDVRYSLKSPIGLYSELENKIEGMNVKQSPAAQWKNMINALTQKGVKPDEIQWSGVNDWLDLQTGKVSKDDLLSYLKNNGVQVKETVLKGNQGAKVELSIRFSEGRNKWEVIDEQGNILESGMPDRDSAEAVLDGLRQSENVGTKYEKYILPGGNNYREVLLTLPQSKKERRLRELELARVGGNATLDQRMELADLEDSGIKDTAYYSQHWAQPNVLAHIRVNDRVDNDGNRVLFVEEIQSDWGQEGKKRGFVKELKGDAKEYAELYAKFENGTLTENDYSRFYELQDNLGGGIEAERYKGGVPVAPFVSARQFVVYKNGEELVTKNKDGKDVLHRYNTADAAQAAADKFGGNVRDMGMQASTEGWLNLALKRIIIMAAEGRYDKVAFVNGEQSARRFDLSKEIDRIEYRKQLRNAGYQIIAFKDGVDVVRKSGQSAEQVEALVGKEIAAKIVAGEGKLVRQGYTSLSNLDLKVGGHGMKTFYDTIVPTAVKKLLPKVGGGQMEGVNLLKDSIKSYDSQIMRDDLDKLGEDEFRAKYAVEQPGFTVTPEMREKVATTGLAKFSLPRIDPRIDARVDTITTAREQKGFAQRIVEAISPSTFSSLRQSFLNRYEQLGRYDKLLAEQMGGAALLADQSAESAALMSDLASGVSASAMGYGDRHGGIPVYRNGATVIDRNVKGLIASLAPLAKYGDPKIYQYYQFWAGAKRGKRLDAEGREKLYTQSDFAYANILEGQFPEFAQVQRDLIAFNNGVVKFMVDTEVLSPEQGKEYVKYADYVPFYRQMDGDKTVGPNIFSAISGVRPPKKLKGGDAPLTDFLESLVRNTQSSIQAGMKNAAALRAIKVVKAVGNVPGVALNRLNTQETGPNIINVLEKGKRVSYETPDKLLVEAVGSLNMSELPFMGLISGPSNLLRNLVTKDPGFMLANLIRDSLSTYVTSGQNMMPIAGTMGNFAKALAKRSPGYEALLDAGVIGGYELSQNVEKSGEDLARDLDKKAGKKDPILMRPFKSFWQALETGTTASDAATRALVYERVLAETGNEAEALYRAVEVMNFNRKGNSPLIRILTAAVPFFNARLQGLDLFYRASTGNMNTNDAKAIQLKFWTRGATMMALSVMYYMMVADDEEYKKQEQETKDGNWLIPSLGIRIPIPFEVGVLFKVMPERITAYALGNDTGKDLRESAVRNLINTFAFNPIPQTVKPGFEAVTNFNFFTMRPIVGQGMSDVAPEFQVGPGTSKVAEKVGGQLGISPMKVDHVLKGYTGTMGIYMVDTIDLVMEQFGDGTKANKRFEQLPIIKRFAVDPEARGTVTAYYELKDAVDTFTRTSNLLEKTSKPEEFLAYVKKNAGVFAVKDYVLDLEKEMKELREMRRTITSSSMDGEQKKNLLTTVGRAEQNLTSNIQTVKKLIASTQ